MTTQSSHPTILYKERHLFVYLLLNYYFVSSYHARKRLMGAKEQGFFLITVTLWEPSSRAYDRGVRRSADPQFRSCQGDRSGKDIYVCLKIIFPYIIFTYSHILLHVACTYILSDIVRLYNHLRGLLLSYP